MAPNQREDVTLTHDSLEKSKSHVRAGKYSIVWRNLISVLIYHLAAVYGVYLSFTTASWKTIFFCCLTYYLSIIGITAGAHRLWSHRSYKAKLPLQIFLMLCQSLAGQVSIHEWARDHRVHHKHSDTDADPYNASRGLFFSHVGWTMVKKHPEVKAKGALIDMSDLNENPVVMFQKRHEKWFVILVAHIIPTLLPVYFWNESLHVSFSLNMLRYALSLNAIWSVNSFAHKFGSKPYDKTLFPTENFLANLISLGEGFHNYHHTFPYDYNAGEMGKMMNFSSSFIDFCAWTGLAYDRKTVSNDVLEMRMKRTGDGTRK